MKVFKKNKRSCTLLAAVLVAALLLLSGLFIATHAKHECIGEDCSVCAEIEACAAAIRLLSEAVGTGIVAIFAYMVIRKPLFRYLAGLNLCPVSLVGLKIRLDN